MLQCKPGGGYKLHPYYIASQPIRGGCKIFYKDEGIGEIWGFSKNGGNAWLFLCFQYKADISTP